MRARFCLAPHSSQSRWIRSSLCATALHVSHGPWRGPQPLPSDYRRRAAKVLDPIAVDSTEPQVLRHWRNAHAQIGTMTSFHRRLTFPMYDSFMYAGIGFAW